VPQDAGRVPGKVEARAAVDLLEVRGDEESLAAAKRALEPLSLHAT